MAVAQRTGVSDHADVTPSSRRLFAAGIKRGRGALIVEPVAMSPADRAAHEAASYVRRSAARAA